jgi:hypothetical protein
MKIQRHKIDVEACRTRFADGCERLPRYISYVKDNPSGLSGVASLALKVVRFGSVASPESPLVMDALTIAANALTGMFAVARASGQSVDVVLGSESVNLNGKIDRSIVEAHSWLTAFWASLICRDSSLINSLCETPLERLRLSPTTNPEYRYMLVDALQAFWTGAPDIGRRLVTTLDATDPIRENIHARDWVLFLDVPLIQVLFYVLGRDIKFEDAFIEAVKSHNQYWTASQKRRKDWDGFVSLELSAIAALASERGVPFDCKSEYLVKLG